MTEAAEQRNVMQWSKMRYALWPELVLLHHIPMGEMRDRKVYFHKKTQTWRSYSPSGQKVKGMGGKSGVPDLDLPVPKVFDGFPICGLHVEMKTETGKADPLQRMWRTALNLGGRRSVVCKGFEQAIAEIEAYLSLPFPDWVNVPAFRRSCEELIAKYDAIEEGRVGLI